MAAPRLQLRRGTTAPSGSIALTGEPFFDSSNKNLYVADSASTFIHIGGKSFTDRVNEFLTKSVASTSVGLVKIYDAQATQNYIGIDVPATVTTSYTFTLPPTAGTPNYVLKTDGNGNTDWVAQTGSYTGWSVSDGTNTQAIDSGNTLTVTANSGLDAVVSATDTLTLSLNIDELTAETAVADADTFPFYDATATANRKVTGANLALYVLQEATGDVTFNASGVAAIGSGVIVDGDISATAEIAVSKLADGAARQLLQTATDGTTVEWTSNIDVPGTLDVTNKTTLDADLDVATTVTGATAINIGTGATTTGNTKTISIGTNGATGSTTSITIGTNAAGATSTTTILGDLTITGTTTTVNTTNSVVKDSLIELANGTSGTPTADAGLVIERGALANVFIGYDEGDDVFTVGTTTAVGSSTDVSPTPITFLAGTINLSDLAGTNQVVLGYANANDLYSGSVAGRYLQNITVDFGTY